MDITPEQDAALRSLARSIIGPSPLAIGKRYEHPEDGVIKIVSGYWTDPVYGRVSNFWYWTVEATGETHNGYGGQWPEVTKTAECEHPVLRKITYDSEFDYICASDDHPECHHMVKVMTS